MAEHPSVALLRKWFEAFASRDMATLTQLAREDMVYHVAGTSPLSGEHKGRDAVFAAFGRVGELSGGTYRSNVHDILANDEHAVVLSRPTASRQGRQLDLRLAIVYHVSHGKITEAWLLVEDQHTWDEFWS